MLPRFVASLGMALLGATIGLGQPATAVDRALEMAASGRLEQAVEALLQLEKTNAANPDVQYLLGLMLLKQGRLPEAAERLEAAVRLNPEATEAWLAAAQARLQRGDREGALQAAARARELAPQNPATAGALAMLYAQADEARLAADERLRWARLSDNDRERRIEALAAYVQAGAAGPALALGAELLEEQADARVHFWLARASRLANKPAEAVDHFQRAIQLAPDEPQPYAELAQLFLDHRTPEPAVLILEKAVERFADSVDLRQLLGLAYYGTGDSRRALETFLDAVELAPQSEAVYAPFETLLPSAGERLPDIVAKLEAFVAARPASPIGNYLLAKAREQQGAPAAEAVKLLRQAIAVEPSFWPAYFELHRRLLAAGKAEQAAEALAKTVELNPDYAPARYARAQLYASLGQREKARAERAAHHALVTAERRAEQQRRQEAPRLPYSIAAP